MIADHQARFLCSILLTFGRNLIALGTTKGGCPSIEYFLLYNGSRVGMLPSSKDFL
jgi:hypothetical protein